MRDGIELILESEAERFHADWLGVWREADDAVTGAEAAVTHA